MTTSNGPSLVVLAAGVGSRYGGLKQLEAVGPSGETLLEYSVFDAIRAGFTRVVLVIRPETEDEFRDSLGARLAGHIDVQYVYQNVTDVPVEFAEDLRREKPWGTGHAVLAVETAVDGPFAVINADDFYGRDAFRVIGEFLSSPPENGVATFALAGYEVGCTLSDAGPVSRGLCSATDEGWLERIVEIFKVEKSGDGGAYRDRSGVRHKVDAEALVCMNLWGFTPVIFPELRTKFHDFVSDRAQESPSKKEFLIHGVVQEMIAKGLARVRVLRHAGRWCGITFPEDREGVRRFIARLVDAGEYPTRLF